MLSWLGNDNEGEKGEFSDAFKRAAVKWGVGRFLYDLGVKYLDVKVNGDFKEYYYNGEKVNQIWEDTIYKTYRIKKTERRLMVEIIYDLEQEQKKYFENLQLKLFDKWY